MNNLAETFRAIFALAFTLGLVGLAAWAFRRFGPETLARLTPLRKERRLALVETLVLDPARRLVLVSLDGEERLLLLGEGQALATPPAAAGSPLPRTRSSKASA
jgi:flagellar protein FliO/FliZ